MMIQVQVQVQALFVCHFLLFFIMVFCFRFGYVGLRMMHEYSQHESKRHITTSFILHTIYYKRHPPFTELRRLLMLLLPLTLLLLLLVLVSFFFWIFFLFLCLVPDIFSNQHHSMTAACMQVFMVHF